MTLRDERGFPHFERPGRITKELWPRTGLLPKDPRIRRALELMRRHPATVTRIATDLNLSASRFRHLFKEEINIAPTHYLKLARLEQAKVLIEDSFLRIKEIAASVGLNDVSHFVRDYKACFGQTPSETRGLPIKGPRPTRG